MGADIAYVIASAGVPVVLRDVDAAQLDRARQHVSDLWNTRVKRGKMTASQAADRLANMRFSQDPQDLADVSLAIEAVSERMEVKKSVFRELDRVLPPLALIASNTSALSISELAAVTGRAKRVVGMHFFYPAHMMKLVEVIAGEETARETIAAVMQFSEEIRKIPVKVKECPGFVVNRVLMAAMAEVLRFKEETGVDAADIDQAVTRGGLAPMGPLRLADALGLDVAWEVANTLSAAYGERFRPSQEFASLIAAGHYGIKSGQGFYSYR